MAMNSSPNLDTMGVKFIPLEPVLEIIKSLYKTISEENMYIMEEIWEKLIEKKPDQMKKSENDEKNQNADILSFDEDLFSKLFFPGFFKKSVKEPIKDFLFDTLKRNEKTKWNKYNFLEVLAHSLDDNHYNIADSLLR